ncbi:MAG: hypothetical protein PUE58_07360 [Lachnospiraceae bacterium]|nr:hypothetical protein [Lachnospiraceae bacterium]
MPSWFSDFFKVVSLYNLGQQIWNWFMGVTCSLMQSDTLETISPDAWNFVSNTVYPWMLSAATVLLNLFFMIGFIRQSTNLRENMTIENWVELIIKVIIANSLMVQGISLMQSFFTVASDMKSVFFPSGTSINIQPSDVDVTTVLSEIVVGLIYLLVCIISGLVIMIEVFARFLNLYLLISVAPLALSTMAGGRGLENTAISWFKSFLANVFQIVIIALILRIGGLMISNWGFSNDNGNALDWFDGWQAVLTSLAQITLITSAVKGSDAFMRRAFDLR